MKANVCALLLSPLAAAVPILEQRQRTDTTANEYTNGGCKDIILFFARGSAEAGNMVWPACHHYDANALLTFKQGTIGPPTADALKDAFGSSRVAAEGVDYGALLSTNFNPGGADYAGIAKMKGLFQDAASKCPNSALVAGGYRSVH